ncbi:MAG: hypothetical protein AB8I08_07030 [Sandaracinaceae bacterium]
MTTSLSTAAPRLFLSLFLCACSATHRGEPPEAPVCADDSERTEGDACEGTSVCVTSIPGSTAEHFTEQSCVDGVTRTRHWSEPYATVGDSGFELDAGASDAGTLELDAGVPDPDESGLCEAMCANDCGTPFDGTDCLARCRAGTNECNSGEVETLLQCLIDWCDGLPPCIASVACVDGSAG